MGQQSPRAKTSEASGVHLLSEFCSNQSLFAVSKFQKFQRCLIIEEPF
jgi:hypothetical protein